MTRDTETRLLPWLPAAGVAVALATAAGAADVADVRKELGFLVQGRTTREEVLLRLGLPSARFEGDRILTFRATMHWGRLRLVAREVAEDDRRLSRWDDAEFSLVVVFDERGVLKVYSVVDVLAELRSTTKGSAGEAR